MGLKIISGLKELVDDFDVFFIDIYGVIHDGAVVYNGVIPCLEKFAELGKSVLLLTNMPHRASVVIDRLENIGVPPSLYQHILSAGEDMYMHFQERHDPCYVRLGDMYYFIGPSNPSLLEGLKIHRVSTVGEADYIVVVGPDDWHKSLSDYDGVLEAAANKKIPMICANPNRRGLEPGAVVIEAGAIAAHFEEMGGQVHYHGKPYKNFFENAIRRYPNIAKQRILLVGDSLEVDIVGAQKVRLTSAFVPGGLHAQEFETLYGQLPSLETSEKVFKQRNIFPNYVIPGLIW